MSTDNNQGAPASSLFSQMFGNLGLPEPHLLLLELQRLNGNLERIAPDAHQLAEASQSVSQLAGALERIDPRSVQELVPVLKAISSKVNPQDLRDLTRALQEGTKMGADIKTRLWPG